MSFSINYLLFLGMWYLIVAVNMQDLHWLFPIEQWSPEAVPYVAVLLFLGLLITIPLQMISGTVSFLVYGGACVYLLSRFM